MSESRKLTEWPISVGDESPYHEPSLGDVAAIFTFEAISAAGTPCPETSAINSPPYRSPATRKS